MPAETCTAIVLASRTIDYAYDPADRLTRVDGDFGSVRREDFIHDANGNRIRVERRTLATDVSAAATDTYARTTGTNRLASIATAAGTRTLTHDARGNLAGETRPGSVTATTTYDGYARLTGYTRTGEATLAMAYNGMDERVTLIRGGVTTRFIHDADGRIIGEYTGGPTTPLSEYIWLLPETDDAGDTGGDDGTGGWTPLAVTTANGSGGAQSLLWLHTNHLGTPIAASDASGTAQPLTGFTLPGFPGQLRTLADLYYNQHRDYDPTTGRYIQADPIGLAGDANPYLYAGGNPGRYTDPEGLTTYLITTSPNGLTGSHSAIYVDGPSAVLYDPGGDFNQDHGSGSGQAFWDNEARDFFPRMINAYRRGGEEVRIIAIATTPQEEAEIRRQIDSFGGRSGLYCADTISQILATIPSFRFVGHYYLPRRLANQVARHPRVTSDTTSGPIPPRRIAPIPTLNGN